VELRGLASLLDLGIMGASGARLSVAWFDRVLMTSTVAVHAAEGLSIVARLNRVDLSFGL